MVNFISPIELSELLKKFREKHGLTQAQVAEKLGVTPATICYWEQSKKIKNMRHSHMTKILLLLDDSPPSELPVSPSPPVFPAESVPPVEVSQNPKG